MPDQIMETNNYSLFVMAPFNRNAQKYDALRASMMEWGFLGSFPLRVKKIPGTSPQKFMIYGGQHRFLAAVSLGIPVKYHVISDNAPEWQLIDCTIQESLRHRLERWMSSGNPAYVQLLEYHKKTGVSLSTCIGLLGGGTMTSLTVMKKFRNGTYKIGDLSVANLIGEIVLHCRYLGAPCASKNSFVQALIKVSYAESFDKRTMIGKMSSYPSDLVVCPSKTEYIRMLDKLYNKGSRHKVALEFEANEAARQRNVATPQPKAKGKKPNPAPAFQKAAPETHICRQTP